MNVRRVDDAVRALKTINGERRRYRVDASEACRLIAICVDLIDLCAKVTGKIDPALASIVSYARDEALSEALEIGS